MRLHETLAGFAEIIRSYEVVQYEVADVHVRFKLTLVFINGTELYVRDIRLDGQRRKYAFHWQEESGSLIVRWDNVPHWPRTTFASLPSALHLLQINLFKRRRSSDLFDSQPCPPLAAVLL